MILGFIVAQNSQLMIPHRFQYFLDDFWNFGSFVKIWTVDLLTITKILQKYKKHMGTSLKHIKLSNLRIWKPESFRKCLKALCTVFRFIISFKCLFILYTNLWRCGSEDDKFCINQISKSLDINFISIKKHEMEIW